MDAFSDDFLILFPEKNRKMREAPGTTGGVS
jgi:hypothetical protein